MKRDFLCLSDWSRAELDRIFEAQLEDERSAWEMGPDGSYVQRQPSGRGRESKGCQQVLVAAAEKRQASASRLRRRKPKAIARRSVR